MEVCAHDCRAQHVAQDAGRSYNSELIARLEGSFALNDYIQGAQAEATRARQAEAAAEARAAALEQQLRAAQAKPSRDDAALEEMRRVLREEMHRVTDQIGAIVQGKADFNAKLTAGKPKGSAHR